MKNGLGLFGMLGLGLTLAGTVCNAINTKRNMDIAADRAVCARLGLLENTDEDDVDEDDED